MTTTHDPTKTLNMAITRTLLRHFFIFFLIRGSYFGVSCQQRMLFLL